LAVALSAAAVAARRRIAVLYQKKKMSTATHKNVSVKWTKHKYDVEIDLTESPLVFKAQLFALTGVPVDRQKSERKTCAEFFPNFSPLLPLRSAQPRPFSVMGFKGGLLKDTANWSECDVREGQTVMLVGSADAAVEKPQATPQETTTAAAAAAAAAAPGAAE
jgi:ubiquitin carboxyl-terminal hydrolase 14